MNNLPIFYEIWKFIIVFTKAFQWSVSSTKQVQSLSPHNIIQISILILSISPSLGSYSGLSHSGVPSNILYAFLFSLNRATCTAHMFFLDLTKTTRYNAPRYAASFDLFLIQLFLVKIFSSSFSQTLSFMFLP